MQTPKSKVGTLEVPKRKSPAATPKVARQLKPGSDADSLSSPNQTSRIPKVVQRRSPQSPLSEKNRPGRVADLETQLAQLQDDLKKAKDQLNASESSKRQSRQEAEEAKKRVTAVSAKFEESQQQLREISASDDERIQELRKLSHERDRAWQSELEAVQKQHEFDSNVLASAMNEIDDLKAEIADRRESEAQAREILSKTEMQFNIVNTTAEILRSDCLRAKEAVKSLSFELEQSIIRIQSLEAENGEKTDQLKEELDRTKSVQSTLQIRNAYEQVDLAKSEWSQREAQLTEELNTANTKIDDLRTILLDKETELHIISEKNKSNERKPELKALETNLANLQAKLMDKETELQAVSEENKPNERKPELKGLETNLRAKLMDKETELQAISEENEMLKREIKKTETEQKEANDKVKSLLEMAKTTEQEAKLKLSHSNDESERNSKRVSEQLEAAQKANTEMATEMRKLKVQSEQWRKAAEAAAAMLSNNGKVMEKTGLVDNGYNPMSARNGGSPYSDDSSSPKKRNGNMLKKIGGL